jgi:ankyrin repeat protein
MPSPDDALLQAIHDDDAEAARDALDAGADPLLRLEHFTAANPLMLAADLGSSSCFEALLPRGGYHARSERGWTAGHHAASSGSVKCLLVCQRVARWDARTKLSNHTLLMIAASGAHAAAVDFLLPCSDPLAVNVEGRLALSLALVRLWRMPDLWPGFKNSFQALARATPFLPQHPREAQNHPPCVDLASMCQLLLDRQPDFFLAPDGPLDALERAALASQSAQALDVWGAFLGMLAPKNSRAPLAGAIKNTLLERQFNLAKLAFANHVPCAPPAGQRLAL